MGLFKKEKSLEENIVNQVNPIVMQGYSDLNADLGFLFMILTRKKEYAVAFLIKPRIEQMGGDKGFLNTGDIDDIVADIISDTMQIISPMYKDFLLKKYFNDEEKLIQFITEDVFIDLIKNGISFNNEKIKRVVIKGNLKNVEELQKSFSNKED